MDGTFQVQSRVIALARAAQSSEAEVCGSRGPRDRYLPEQRVAAGLRKGMGARADHGGARPGGGSGRYGARQAAPGRRTSLAHQRHQPSKRAGIEPGSGEIHRGAAPDAEIARSATWPGARVRVWTQRYRQSIRSPAAGAAARLSAWQAGKAA